MIMKKILLLTLAVLLLTGCHGDNTNKEVETSLNTQQEIVFLNDETDEKVSKQEKTSQQAIKSDDKKKDENKEAPKVSSKKKSTSQITTNKQNTKSENNNNDTKTNEEKKDTSKKKTTTKKEKNDNKKSNESEKKKQETEIKKQPHKHMFTVNGGWYKTSNEAVKKFQSLSDMWNRKYENGEISWDEYCRKCPNGYEIYRCTCGMHGLNLTYN